MIALLILLQVGTFIVIIVALRFLFARQLAEAMQRVKALDEESRIKEKYLQQEMARIDQERQAALAKAKEEADQLLEQSKRTGDIIQRNLEEQGKLTAAKYVTEGQEEILKLKRSLFDANREYIFNLTTDVLSRILTEQLSDVVHHEFVREIIDAIAAIDQERLGTAAQVVTIICYRELRADERQALQSVLSEKAQSPLVFQERIEPDLLGGIVIQFGVVVLDGSMKHKIDTVIGQLKPIET